MLRALVVVLILANMGFFAWREGWLGGPLGQAHAGREPERIKAQVHPERLVVEPPAAASASATGQNAAAPDEASAGSEPASVPASGTDASARLINGAATGGASTVAVAAGPMCVEAGPFNPAEQRQVTPQLAQLASGSWTLQNVAVQGLWLVYMGPYGDAEALARKQDELRRIRGLSFEEVRSPANLAMGVSLGRYNQEAQAHTALETLRQRGIRTARVVTVRPAQDVAVVRVPQASLAVQRVLAGMNLPAGKGFEACKG
jgi:hypothetical protein